MKKTIKISFTFSVLLFNFCFLFFSTVQAADHQLEKYIVNASGDTTACSTRIGFDSIGEPAISQIRANHTSIQAGYFNEYFFRWPTPTVSPTGTVTPTITPTLPATITCTPIRAFGNEIMSEHYVFAAPNPIRGTIGHLYFDISESAEVTLKIFTPSNQFVLSQHWDNLAAGTNHWDWHAGNMANGVYLMWIRARGVSGKVTTIVKKIALIK